VARLKTHLTVVDLSMFNSEIYQLIDSLLYRLEELDKLSGSWKAANRRAERTANIATEETRDTFQRALHKQARTQGRAFDAIEAFLASWARLSLFFFPVSRARTSRERGEVLRKVWLVNARSPLADRGLRNAWMHFDERMDQAIHAKTLGNRQQFTTAKSGARAAVVSVRVVEMDTLVVRYRDERGASQGTNLRELRPYLTALAGHFTKVQRRFRALTK